MPIVRPSSTTVAPIAVHRIHESRRGMNTSTRAVAAGRKTAAVSQPENIRQPSR